MKNKPAVHFTVHVGLMSAVLIVSQVVAAGIPNIELVSFLIIMYTLHQPKLAKYVIAIFVVLQGIIYGLHIWWISYLYIWYILYFVTLVFKKHASMLSLALLSALFGLLFGTLGAVPQFFISGVGGGIAYIIAGIPFDIAHCIGNFFIMIVLYAPINRLLLHIAARHTQK